MQMTQGQSVVEIPSDRKLHKHKKKRKHARDTEQSRTGHLRGPEHGSSLRNSDYEDSKRNPEDRTKKKVNFAEDMNNKKKRNSSDNLVKQAKKAIESQKQNQSQNEHNNSNSNGDEHSSSDNNNKNNEEEQSGRKVSVEIEQNDNDEKNEEDDEDGLDLQPPNEDDG
eukprot:UN27155